LCNVPWTAVTFLPFAKIKIKEGHVMQGIGEYRNGELGRDQFHVAG
jgi:hypothetical protein